MHWAILSFIMVRNISNVLVSAHIFLHVLFETCSHSKTHFCFLPLDIIANLHWDTAAWLWTTQTCLDLGRWVWCFSMESSFSHFSPDLMIICVYRYILHECVYFLYRSQFMTRRTSRGSVLNLPQPARTSWSVVLTTSVPSRWSVERK